MVKGMVKFIRMQEWEPLSYTSRFMLPPSEDDMLKDFIENRLMNYFHPLLVMWGWLSEKANLRLQAVAGTSPPGLSECVNFALLGSVDTERKHEVETMKFASLLFPKRLDDAVNTRPITVSNGSNFVVTALSSIFIFMSEGSIERAQTRLKEAETFYERSLRRWITFNAYGVRMRRIVSLIWARFNLRWGSFDLRFLSLIRLRFFSNLAFDCTKDAISIFSASGEYHSVLFLLLKLVLVADTHSEIQRQNS